MIKFQIMRFFLMICIVIGCFSSCDYMSFTKKKDPLQTLDTIIDFSSVDMPPKFAACSSIIDKQQLFSCFGKEMHVFISKQLEKTNLKVKKSLDETLEIKLKINNRGQVILESISTSELVSSQLPELTQLIQKAVSDLPQLQPALKRGIPVATEYILPLRIKLAE